MMANLDSVEKQRHTHVNSSTDDECVEKRVCACHRFGAICGIYLTRDYELHQHWSEFNVKYLQGVSSFVSMVKKKSNLEVI